MKIIVKAKLVIEGLHRWMNCDIEEVKYLKSLHRHQFHIIAEVIVRSDNREVEFIELSHSISDYLLKKYWSLQYKCCYFNHLSCEQIALELVKEFGLYRCEVNEDNEGGAIIENY